MGLSTYQTLRPKKREYAAKQLPNGIKPLAVDWGDGGRFAILYFSDGKSSPGSCIRCIEPLCMYYSGEELELKVFEEFPADQNNEVCPSSAITWPVGSDAPIVDTHSCIVCGLCVSRCPVRAIWLDGEGAHVNDVPNEHFQIESFPATLEQVRGTSRLFEGIPDEGFYLLESDVLMSYFRAHFQEVSNEQSSQFPNHLARNLLIAVGVGAGMRRRGDTNIRMDLVLGPPGVERGTGEVELGAGILDAPRNILDNVAVLVGRYNISKDEIVPMVVSLDLPNQRSEYWQVIKDVRDVLDVKINSITIGALVVCVWSRTVIRIRTGEEFYVDIDSLSLRPKLEALVGRALNIKNGYPGCLESPK